MGRSTTLVRVPRKTADGAKALAAKLPGITAGQVLAEAHDLQLLVVAVLHELGAVGSDGLNLTAHRLLESHNAAVLERRVDLSQLGHRLAATVERELAQAEAAWKEGAGQALEELEARYERELDERARELATEALPHHVEAAVKALFAAQGMPVPPISVGADGSLEIGDPPKGLGPIEA